MRQLTACKEFPGLSTGEGDCRGRLAVSLSCGDGPGSLGKPRQLELAVQSTKEERAAEKENSRDLQRVPLDVHRSPEQHMDARKPLETGERTI